jgi:hypothetical protein
MSHLYPLGQDTRTEPICSMGAVENSVPFLREGMRASASKSAARRCVVFRTQAVKAALVNPGGPVCSTMGRSSGSVN